MLARLEKVFDSWRGSCDCSQDLITFATSVGIACIAFKLIGYGRDTYRAARLYLFSQVFSKTNYVKRYGKWVVISGGTDGIGLAMAKEFAKRGHSIIVIGRNEEKLLKTKKSLESIEKVGEVETIRIDLSNSDISNFERIRAKLDPDRRDIGILVNNAGIFVEEFKRFNNYELDSYRSLVNVNILSLVYLTRMVSPAMIFRGRGLVVNVSSLAGRMPAPYASIYGATKSFVNAFSKSLQIEYAAHPIDVVCLTPGGIDTKLLTSEQKKHLTDKSSFLVPSPEHYAKVAINAMSTRIETFTGYWPHGLILRTSHFLSSYLGIVAFERFLRDQKLLNNLSPVVKRRNKK